MKLSILGGGNVGSALATKLHRKFSSVTISARDVAKTRQALREKGETIEVTSVESLKDADVIILATPGIYDEEDIREFVLSMGDLSDKILIDATNPLGSFPDGLQVRTWEGGISSSEKLQAILPSTKVYKAFNTVGFEHMADACGDKDMFIAGDGDSNSRSTVESIVQAVGFNPFYVGPIRYARNLEAIAELWIHMAIPGLGARDVGRNFWFSLTVT
ncbi:hypothetical protein THAOC_08232 [Thalassiosira oceanica]|uniref:Pyrroline-5-carboxylate reductase catalytic N-terminal domain-containing protein n=1 Tax=Thalassiosira oceanica TaxID=159749 RepID=K0TIM9_THAOC|nr:hypothetical protein THAOC_08232 [Thalassiosira oceanica]|eukprot:EJK70412.1 hypothetical protein THAOC_08232 [Thalassiosira oceanica]